VRVQIIHNQYNHFCIGVVLLQKNPDLLGPVQFLSMFRHAYPAPTSERFSKHKNVGNTATMVFHIVLLRITWLGGNRNSNIRHKLLSRLIHTYHRPTRIKGAFVHLKYIFHGRYKFATISSRNAPALT